MPGLPWVRSISTVSPSPAPAPWQQGLEPHPSLSSPRFIIWKKVTDRPGALHQQHMIPTPKSLQHTRPQAGKTGLWSTGDHQGVRDPGWEGAGDLIHSLGATGFRCLPVVTKSNRRLEEKTMVN